MKLEFLVVPKGSWFRIQASWAAFGGLRVSGFGFRLTQALLHRCWVEGLGGAGPNPPNPKTRLPRHIAATPTFQSLFFEGCTLNHNWGSEYKYSIIQDIYLNQSIIQGIYLNQRIWKVCECYASSQAFGFARALPPFAAFPAKTGPSGPSSTELSMGLGFRV